MHLDHLSAGYLKTWMIAKLKPMQVASRLLFLAASSLHSPARTDADPAVLSDYVTALLRHDQSVGQLKASCLSQLEDFLQKRAQTPIEPEPKSS